ncbi:unnamed protein product [Cylindrotheca closterium]|uniref:C3H1-type domain-containing protein n=1 Tax=Cylindrotheca closterium TaxID=2856 RepID=A0AAD2FQT5_9STRA|nr:unnamed protein product [Cylindrotheca closterium]
MELESKALSIPRGKTGPRRRRQRDERRREPDDMSSVSTSSSANNGRQKRRSRSSAAVVTPQRKRRRRNEDEGTLVVYNLHPEFNNAHFVAHIERRISEMRDVEVEVASCRALPAVDGKVTALVTFQDSEEALLALCLSGIKYKGRTLYARIYDPDKKRNETMGLLKKKQELCMAFFVGACPRGRSCIHAHGVLDLKYYNDTVLDESRCVYINEVPKDIGVTTLHKIILDQFKHEPFLTHFKYRRNSGDAMIEFANPVVASTAFTVLDGYQFHSSTLAVHPWKPEYHTVFAAYFSNDDTEDEDIKNEEKSRRSDASSRFQRSNGDGNSATKSPRRDRKTDPGKAVKCDAAPNGISVVPQSKANPKLTQEEKQKQDQIIFDLKATMISLREELLQAKTDAVTAKEKANDMTWKNKELTQDHTYNLQKIETLEKDNTDLNKLLDEVKEDVRYYREKLESKRSDTQDHRRMEETIDRLRRENDAFRRQSLESKHEQEQPRRRIQELERRLGAATDRNDVYLKDLKNLREKVQQLETTNRRLEQQDSIADSLELKLEEAVSRNKKLAEDLTKANEKVDRLEYENHHLRNEQAAMQEELKKVRASSQATGRGTGSAHARSKMKQEPTN